MKTTTTTLALILAGAMSGAASTFTVTQSIDPGDGACNFSCTLREAINAANANPGHDTIVFNIPFDGVHTITPLTPLPLINDPVTIDGYTQDGASENTLAVGNNAVLLIELDGSLAGDFADGLLINGVDDCFIRGLVINRFSHTGLFVGSVDSFIEGNFIGTDPSGTIALGNQVGLLLDELGPNIIGGLAPAARNIISGNTVAGIFSSLGHRDEILGNYIGTDPSGTSSIPNAIGVRLHNARDSIIGGADPGAGNLISGNTTGIFVDTFSDGLIQGNLIGPDVTGKRAPKSGTLILGGNGVHIDTGADPGTVVGGAGQAGNIIAFNGKNGIEVSGDSTGPIGQFFFGNSIFSNGGLGIDLVGGSEDANGVTANDSLDSDTGPNNLQNYPVISGITASGSDRTVVGELNSKPNTDYVLDFYSNSEVDPSGFGEGETYLGFLDVHTNPQGRVEFSFPLEAGSIGQFITATASDADGTSEFSLASEVVPPLSRFQNISTRLRVQTGDNVLIGGFIIDGTEAKQVIVRAIGPSLGDFGVADPLANPILELNYPDGTTVVTNNNWRDTQEAEITATGLAPNDDLESAIVATLDPGAYTAIVRGVNASTGVGLVETYDLAPEVDSSLANISTRGLVETGDNVMIGGIIVGPELAPSGSILIRGIGPSLSDFGVPNALADPTLELRDANGVLLTANDNWKSTQQSAIEATGLQPTDDNEAAILATLASGNYTAIMRGVAGTTGIGLVEAYHLN